MWGCFTCLYIWVPHVSTQRLEEDIRSPETSVTRVVRCPGMEPGSLAKAVSDLLTTEPSLHTHTTHMHTPHMHTCVFRPGLTLHSGCLELAVWTRLFWGIKISTVHCMDSVAGPSPPVSEHLSTPTDSHGRGATSSPVLPTTDLLCLPFLSIS